MDAFGTIVNTPHIRWIESGYISIEFVLVKKNSYFLWRRKAKHSMVFPYLLLNVLVLEAGPLDVSNCMRYGSHMAAIFQNGDPAAPERPIWKPCLWIL